MFREKRVIGIICECNPFHKGHIRLINEAKKHGDILIAIMSGNFVQRGEPSIYDKYKRTKNLLKSGIDIVIELPIEYSLSSARYFALASISIFNKLKIVDSIIFGSHINDINKLTEISKIESDDIKKYLKSGMSYPKAMEMCYQIKLSPNDILGVEYIRAINDTKSKIVPISIKRKNDLPSATSLRKNIKKSIDINSFSEILAYKISKMSLSEMKEIYTLNDDLSHAILNTKNLNISFEKRADLLNTKNRTLSNIKRAFFNIIFDIKNKDIKIKSFGKKVTYIRILGIKKEAMLLLKYLDIPYLLSFANKSYKDFSSKFDSKILDEPSIKTNIFASNIYYLLSGDKKAEVSKAIVVL